MLSETLEDRIAWFDSNHYERSNTNFIVNESGLELDFKVNNDSLKFNLETKSRLRYLIRKNVADIIIIELIDSENIKLHIIECKTSVKIKTWAHIKTQFEGAVLNVLAVLGLLNISESNIQDIQFYTAYKNDNISHDRTQPIMLRRENIRQIDEWEKGEFSILSLSKAAHTKIQLDESGKGECFCK